MDSIPRQLEINTEITMNEKIAHTGDLPPGNVWKRLDMNPSIPVENSWQLHR